MLKNLSVTLCKNLSAALALSLVCLASAGVQNTNSSTSAPRHTTRRQTTTTTTTTTTTPSTPTNAQETTTTPPAATARTRRTRTAAAANTDAATRTAVRTAFDALVDGITRADADAVMALYWNSPQLVIFNNNGTVTKSWAQVRENRRSLYANVRDVKLATSDVRVQPFGPDTAVVTALWTQAQVYKGTPESATGRLTLVFRRFGTDWKIVHAHTSPDAPDPSRLLPSEQRDATTQPSPSATPTPTNRRPAEQQNVRP